MSETREKHVTSSSWLFLAICSVMMLAVTLWMFHSLYGFYQLQREDIPYQRIEGTLLSFDWDKYKSTRTLEFAIEGYAEMLIMNDVPQSFTSMLQPGHSQVRTHRQSRSDAYGSRQAYGLWVNDRERQSVEESRAMLRSSFNFFLLFATSVGLGGTLIMARLAWVRYRKTDQP